MSLVLTSLNAVSAPTIGAVASYDVPRIVSFQVVATGSPSSISCQCEGSLDGINWSIIASGSLSVMTVATAAVLFARANLTNISGGTSPTITATIAALP